MPSAQLKSFAKKSDKSMADLERYWKEAKEEAAKKFKKKSSSFWAYVVAIVERRAGLRKSTNESFIKQISLKDFLMFEGKKEIGWYVERNDKLIEGPMEEAEADAKVKELGGDAKGYSKTYVSDYELHRKMNP